MIASIRRVLREAREFALREPETGPPDSIYDLGVLVVVLIDLIWVMFGSHGS